MPLSALLSLVEIRARVDEAVRRSPADGISVTWLEARREVVCEGGRPRAVAAPLERTIVVRVRDGGRLGESRTGSGEPSDLEAAVRLAVAGSRVAPRTMGWERPPQGEAGGELPTLFDPAIAALDPESARRRLAELVGRREAAELDWAEGRLVVGGDLATARAVAVTAVSLRMRCGRRPGSGSAGCSARTLAGLAFEEIVERARFAHGGTGLAELPGGPAPAVLSPLAATTLLEGLAGWLARPDEAARWGATWKQGLMAAGIDCRDEPCGEGLPLPWDLLGRPRSGRSFPDAEGEKPPGPWAEQPIGRNLQLRGTAPRAESELLAAAAGGLWIGSVEGVELVPAGAGLVRWTGRGLRLVQEAGALGEPVADALFELGLGELAAGIRGCGTTVSCRAAADRLWGAVSAPALALSRLPAGRPLPI